MLLAFLVPLVWIAAYRWIDPPGGPYMFSEWLSHGRLERAWRDLEDISPEMARAAIAAEDARFCAHWGIDLDALGAALADGGRRGASTISQQVAKNVFLWHGRSWVRKGLEAGIALLIERLWGKRRILEIYLNVAEFGPAVFGAEAAARHHFGMRAAELDTERAARLAAVLPKPKARNPARLSGALEARASRIAEGARTVAAQGLDTCVKPLE